MVKNPHTTLKRCRNLNLLNNTLNRGIESVCDNIPQNFKIPADFGQTGILNVNLISCYFIRQ